MTKDKKRISISILCTLSAFLPAFLLFQFLYQVDNKYTAGPPYGTNGIFNFSEHDLNRTQPLFLIDGWEFYPDAALTPSDFGPGNPCEPSHVFIGQYPNFSFLSSGHSAFGKATYRINLGYGGSRRILELEIPEIFTDYRLWINGQEVIPTGASIAFLAGRNTELVLAVENQSHYYSGLTYPPALGIPETIQKMFFWRNLFYSVLCLVPLTLCLYAAAAWFSRERNRRFVHFGLLCLFFSIHCAYPFLHQINLTGTLWYAIEDVTWMAVLYEIIALCTVEIGLDGKLWYRRGVRPLAIAACVLSGLSVLFILPEFSGIINLYGNLLDSYKLLCWLYLLGCAAWGVSAGHSGTNIILAGGGILGAAIVVNLLDNNRFEPIFTGWQTEYAGFFLVLLFWLQIVWHVKELLRRNLLLTEHLEDEVQRRTHELHTVLDERKAFFSDLAHNLKAPMAAIHGFTDLIMRGNLYLDNDLRGYLDKINGANEELCRRMQALGDLNAYDKITEPPQQIDIDNLLSQIYADNEPEAAISGILFHVEKLNEPIFIYAQRKKLLLLFENLIYNAFSVTPEDGSITVSPRMEDGLLVITVSDTGTGITPEHLPHVFERFYIGRENKSEGSGLGLYIAQITVDELGGSIAVDSTVGIGTVFTIRLPVILSSV